jgi:hypothetical protein
MESICTAEAPSIGMSYVQNKPLIFNVQAHAQCSSRAAQSFRVLWVMTFAGCWSQPCSRTARSARGTGECLFSGRGLWVLPGIASTRRLCDVCAAIPGTIPGAPTALKQWPPIGVLLFPEHFDFALNAGLRWPMMAPCTTCGCGRSTPAAQFL